MKEAQRIELEHELDLIRMWEETWGNEDDEDSRIAREIRREEISRLLNGYPEPTSKIPATRSPGNVRSRRCRIR